MAGSSKDKWQKHVSWSSLATAQMELSQSLTQVESITAFPLTQEILWKPSTVHLFFALVLGLKDEWDEDGG